MESFFQEFISHFGVTFVTTGEQVNCRITQFRPCMNCQMAFRDNNYSAYTVRTKHMKTFLYNSCTALKCSVNHKTLNFLRIVQNIGVTFKEFSQNVLSKILCVCINVINVRGCHRFSQFIYLLCCLYCYQCNFYN